MVCNTISLTLSVNQSKRETVQKASIVCRPEVTDDFIRNFLVRMNMHRTLDCFETEWSVIIA